MVDRLEIPEEFYERMRASGVPLDVIKSLSYYFFHGLRPGGFLEAMLAYDYSRALYNADSTNAHYFYTIARWIRDFAPEGSHGSYDHVDTWVEDVAHRRSKWASWMVISTTSSILYEY